VELNAEILANLLYLQPAYPLSLSVQWLLILLAGGLPLWFFSAYNPRLASVGSLALLAITVGGMEGAFWFAGQVPSWAPVLVGLLGSTLGMGLQSAIREHAQKQQIRERFGQFVSPKLVEQIVRNPDQDVESGRRQHVAVLFSDVRDFTPYSERHSPELVMRQMREYLDEMAATVFEQDGVLDKFIGDAVMGLFGPFLEPGANVSARGIASGLAMLDRLETINTRWAAEGLPQFRIGIGVHVGEAVVGVIGTSRRQQFTALGDTVNVAARLESATKVIGVPLLVTDAARAEAAPVLGAFVEFLDRGEIQVKGREQPVQIFEVRRRTAAASVTGVQGGHDDAG
jgi:adenylate cyclase